MHYYLPGVKVLGIKAETVAIIFILPGDITSFLVQAGGDVAADGATDPNVIRIALLVYTSGMALQQLFILFFFAITIAFHRQLVARRRRVLPIYAVLVSITIRVIYRIAEYASGAIVTDITTHEAYYYALDATPVFLALVIFCVWHPGKILVGAGSEFPKKEGRGWCCCCCGRRAKKSTGQKTLPETPMSLIEEGNTYSPGSRRTRTFHRHVRDRLDLGLLF